MHREELYNNKTYLNVDLEHVRKANEDLANHLEERPAQILPLVSQPACHSRQAPSQAA